RRRIDEIPEIEASKQYPVKEIVSTLILLDEEEKSGQQNWKVESQQHSSLFQSNTQQNSHTMNEYNIHFQDHYDNNVTEADQS
ncbi:hypothetical protein ACO1MG_13965, partial [Staphylococcus aureus]